MRNIKITIEYDGTNYHGWQIQPNATTIQAAIQDALAKIIKTEVQIIGAGRTDTGVHAAGQVANFHTRSQMLPIAFQRALNATLPRDIVIVDVKEVPPDFHARFSAVSRTYRYTILNRAYPSALLRSNTYFFPESIDVQGANTICQLLVGKGDFSSLQRSGSERINPICEIYECRCWREEDLVHFEVEADAFLRGMVRAIVGTVLKLHDKKDGVNQLRGVLDARDRAAAGASVPPHGLALLSIKY